ncbi:MAG TPA: hypothetical protein QGF02_00725 [Candidatus Babeliales bacterium]|nr:hypothetical protein [Candidatus Babeliales bacterium]
MKKLLILSLTLLSFDIAIGKRWVKSPSSRPSTNNRLSSRRTRHFNPNSPQYGIQRFHHAIEELRQIGPEGRGEARQETTALRRVQNTLTQASSLVGLYDMRIQNRITREQDRVAARINRLNPETLQRLEQVRLHGQPLQESSSCNTGTEEEQGRSRQEILNRRRLQRLRQMHRDLDLP